MDKYKRKVKSALKYIYTFLKWFLLAGIVGLVSGVVGTLFHKSVELATDFRIEYDWIIVLLPVGGLVIAILYNLSRMADSKGTNQIISSIRSNEKVPIVIAPLIFVSTVITHLFGGSAGREGAALQLGGSIGSEIGSLFHLDEKDMHLITLCGMSGVFAALFGTPLTATLFAMEVISVGVIYYSSFVPCIVSSLVAYGISLFFGIQPVRFELSSVPILNVSIIAKTVLLALFCAAVSIIFCMAMHKTQVLAKRLIQNEIIRIMVGGIIIVILTILIKSNDYNGAGMNIITEAIGGHAKTDAFLLKIVFTAITIAVGYKGGEIVPTFFIGATFGCVMGGLLGINPGFAAAIGLVALFCGVVNCPIASIILSIELFGSDGVLLFAIACGVSYMLSGYYGIYSSQKIMYSKLKAEYININAK